MAASDPAEEVEKEGVAGVKRAQESGEEGREVVEEEAEAAPAPVEAAPVSDVFSTSPAVGEMQGATEGKMGPGPMPPSGSGVDSAEEAVGGAAAAEGGWEV